MILKQRMKQRSPRLIFLSGLAMDIMIALQTFAGSSDYILPSRYDSDMPLRRAILNRFLTLTSRLAQREGESFPELA